MNQEISRLKFSEAPFFNKFMAFAMLVLFFGFSFYYGPDHGSVFTQIFKTPLNETPFAVWGLSAFLFVFLGYSIYKNPDMFDNNIVYLGGAMLFIDAWHSYRFYHANSHKMLVFYVIVLILMAIYWKQKNERGNHFFLVWFFLFLPVLTALPGGFLDGFRAYNFTYEFSALFPLAIFGAIFYIAFSENKLEQLVKWLALIMVIITTWAIFEKLTGYSDYAGRSRSTFGNPTYYAAYIIVVLMPMLAWLLHYIYTSKGSLFIRVKNLLADNELLVFGVIFSFIGLYLSGTRASQLGFIIGIFVTASLVLWEFNRKKFFKYFFSLVVVIAVLILIMGTLYYFFDRTQFYHLLIIFRPEAFFGRFNGWVPAWHAFIDSPFIGHGLGSSYNLYFNYFWDKSLFYNAEVSYNHVHSEYLELLEEGGILGFIGQFGMIAVFLYFLFKLSFKRDAPLIDRVLAAFLIGAIVANYVDSVFSISFRQMAARVPVYMVYGIGLYLIEKNLKIISNLKKIPRLFYNSYFKIAVIGVIIIWNLFYFSKWLYVQYKYIDSFDLPYASSIQAMKDTLPIHRDIYLLDDMTVRMVNNGQYDDAVKYLDVALDVIPYFRMLEFRRCASYMQLNNLPKAYESCKAQQSKNPYIVGNFSILSYLSVALDHKDGFYEAVKSGITFFLVGDNNEAFGSNYPFKTDATKITVFDYSSNTIEEDPNQKELIRLEFNNKILKIIVSPSFYEKLVAEYNEQNKTGNKTLLPTAIAAAQGLQHDKFIIEFLNTNKDQINGHASAVQNLLTWVSRIARP